MTLYLVMKPVVTPVDPGDMQIVGRFLDHDEAAACLNAARGRTLVAIKLKIILRS